jgi:hypothetical protein
LNAQSKAASRPIILLVATAALALSLAYLVRPVLATEGDPHKVTICHRTNSVTNPYVVETVDVASVDGDNGNDNGKGDHLLEHTGPVWDANTVYPTPHNGDQWGDIIPPFYADGVTPTGFPSLNWDAAGQALFDNRCNFPGEVEESVAESAEQSVEGSGEHSVAASASGEQSVDAGTGTPAASQSDGAFSLSGAGALRTIAFSLILLASLGALAYANVRSVRSRS